MKNTFTPIEKFEVITALTLFSLITAAFPAACSSENPVVPTTRFTPHAAAVLMVSTAAKATGQKGKNKESLLTDGFSVKIKGKSDLAIYEIQIEEN